MDEDTEHACLYQLELEQAQFENEQQILRDDPQFTEWLEAKRNER